MRKYTEKNCGDAAATVMNAAATVMQVVRATGCTPSELEGGSEASVLIDGEAYIVRCPPSSNGDFKAACHVFEVVEPEEEGSRRRLLQELQGFHRMIAGGKALVCDADNDLSCDVRELANTEHGRQL
jgi:hypothetical protein